MAGYDVFASCFGPGNFSEFDSTNGSPTVISSGAHCGLYCQKTVNNNDYSEVSFSPLTESYVSFMAKVDTEPTGASAEAIRIVSIQGNSGANDIARAYFYAAYGVKYFRFFRLYPNNLGYNTPYNWQINTWYHFEIYFNKDASGQYILKINNAIVCDTGTLNTSAAPDVDTVQFGITGYQSYITNVFHDCCRVSTIEYGMHDQSREVTFETGDFSQCDGTVGSPSITELKVHCGVYGCECSVSSGNTEGPIINIGHQKEGYLEFEIKFDDAIPSGGDRFYFAFLRDFSNGVNILSVFIYNDGGTVKWGYTYRVAGSTTTVNSGISTNPSADEWYCVKIAWVMSSKDGVSDGAYAMSIDGTLLSDIDQTTVDTDYTGIAFLRVVTYTTASGGCINYLECIEYQTTDISCHETGAEEPGGVEDVESDCTPPVCGDWLQVYRNCERIDLENIQVEAGHRGIGSLTIPFNYSVQRGDLFHVIVEGSTILQGHVVSVTKNRGKGTKTLNCQTKTARLYGKHVLNENHRTYSSQDVGAIAKDLIDYYFDGLFTSNNVNETTGIVVSDFDCYDKSVGTALEELAKRGNCSFYVDSNNDVHFFVKGTEKTEAVFNSDNIIGALNIDESGEIIRKVIVKGISGVSGEAGSGVPEVLKSDRRITSNSEAQEVAEAWLENYSEIVTTTFSVNGFFNLKNGQGAVLDMPLDGYDYESIVLQKIVWHIKPGKTETKITVGNLAITFEQLLSQTLDFIAEQQVNRISSHSGSDTGNGDPALEYAEILAQAYSAEVNVQTSTVTLTSGVCSSDSDASHLAVIILDLAWGSVGGGSGNFLVTLTNSTTAEIYYKELHYLASNIDQLILRLVVCDDLSGDTLLLEAKGHTGCNVYVKSKMTVRQILTHSHDVTQALGHEFD